MQYKANLEPSDILFIIKIIVITCHIIRIVISTVDIANHYVVCDRELWFVAVYSGCISYYDNP